MSKTNPVLSKRVQSNPRGASHSAPDQAPVPLPQTLLHKDGFVPSSGTLVAPPPRGEWAIRAFFLGCWCEFKAGSCSGYSSPGPRRYRSTFDASMSQVIRADPEGWLLLGDQAKKEKSPLHPDSVNPPDLTSGRGMPQTSPSLCPCSYTISCIPSKQSVQSHARAAFLPGSAL